MPADVLRLRQKIAMHSLGTLVMELLMYRQPIRFLARILAISALCLQLLLPATVAMAQENGVDVSQYICVTPGVQPSAKVKAQAARLAALTSDTDDQKPLAYSGHCPLCSIAHCAPLPTAPDITLPAGLRLPRVYTSYESGIVYEAQGPPVGSRGPPSLI